jgi:hypothetical protein
MRFVAACAHALRPFTPCWIVLFGAALLLTFGFGGGTPNSTGWLITRFLVLGLLLTTLLGPLASQLRAWLIRTRRHR